MAPSLSAPSGRSSVREWAPLRLEHPERKAARDRRQWVGNPERRRKARERFERWRIDNPQLAEESERRANERYRAHHPDRIAALHERRRADPEFRRKRREQAKDPEFKRLRGARERFERFLHSSPDWYRIVAAFDFACAYCGVVATIEIDHLRSVANGGLHEIGNVVPCCKSCNSAKKGRPLHVFATERGLDELEIRRKASASV